MITCGIGIAIGIAAHAEATVVLRHTVNEDCSVHEWHRGVMEILEAIHALHDVHLRDKCERAVTAVQRTIDLYGCGLPENSIPEGFQAFAIIFNVIHLKA